MAGKLNFIPHKKGTTLLQQNFRIEELADGAVNLTGAIIRMQFRTSQTGPTEFEFTSLLNGGLTISNALNGEFYINEQIINLPAFDYIYGLQINFPNGTVDEFLEGIWSIVEDNVNL